MLTAAIPGRSGIIIGPRGAHIYRYAAVSFCPTDTIIKICICRIAPFVPASRAAGE